MSKHHGKGFLADTSGFIVATADMIQTDAEESASVELVDDMTDDSWPILLQTFGIISLIILVRLLVWELLKPAWKGQVTLSDTNPIYTGLFFLLGAVFNAVNADFKEAEKLPMDIANSLDQLEDSFVMSFSKNAKTNGCLPREMRFLVMRATRQAHRVLSHACDVPTFEIFLERLRDLNVLGHEWERRGATNVAPITVTIDKIRRSISRASVISRTDTMPAMRAALTYFVTIGTITMSITIFANETALSFVLASVLVVFWFMLRVIQAVDDPFDQSTHKGWRRYVFGQIGCVSLFPLRESLRRMDNKLRTYAGDE
jgi:type IV secretory pathway VirB3-like protein